MKKVLAIICSVSTLFIGCTIRENNSPEWFERGVLAGQLDNPKIDEASGLAASISNPGMLWTHNDSGDKARIFLIDSVGRHRLTVSLEGIKHRDWEDIAVGPGPDSTKTYVYIGEIGDNNAKHKYKYIYRMEEPVMPKKKMSLTVQAIDSIKFSLPDGKRDAESLMIDPHTRDLYIFSKRESAVNLYRLPFPQSTTEKMVAEKTLSELPFTKIVAADWSPDGKEILIKNYLQVYYWRRENNEPVEELLLQKPFILPYDEEPQGESIAFHRKGKGYYTVSEQSKGRIPELKFYRRITQEIE